jgi:hypothetical protein
VRIVGLTRTFSGPLAIDFLPRPNLFSLISHISHIFHGSLTKA